MVDLYYRASEPGSYGGVQPLARYSGASIKTARDWLSTQDAYTLHRPVRKKFPRRKTYSKGIGDLFQADLADMQNLSKFNDGMRFILTCVDVFSKVAYAVAIKDKRGPTVADAFEKNIFALKIPTMLQTDRGTEFLAAPVQAVFKKYNVHHYWSLNDDIKAACVERFNRTLKTRLFRYMTHKKSARWIDVLDDVVNSYNHSYHRSIGMAPADVTLENQDVVTRRLYPVKPKPVWKFNVGDTVRIAKYKHVLHKGYLPNWSEEIFKIVERYPTFPVTYGLQDLAGEEIKGKFYDQELQKIVKDDDVYDVEKVLKTRKRNGRLEFFVRWRHFPDKFNSWVSDVFTR